MVNVPLHHASRHWRHLTLHCLGADSVDLSQLFHYDCIRIQIRHGETKTRFPCALAPYLVITFYNKASHPFFEIGRLKRKCFPCKSGSFAYSYVRFPKPCCCTMTHFIIAVCESRPPSGGAMVEATGLQYQ